MQIYYSASTNGFYNTEDNPCIPDDSVEISQELYESLLSADAGEKQIVSDENGNPVAEDIIVSLTDAQKLSSFISLIQEALNKSDMVAIRAFKAGIAFGEEWKTYDSALRALMSITEWSDDLALPPQPTTYPS